MKKITHMPTLTTCHHVDDKQMVAFEDLMLCDSGSVLTAQNVLWSCEICLHFLKIVLGLVKKKMGHLYLVSYMQ